MIKRLLILVLLFVLVPISVFAEEDVFTEDFQVYSEPGPYRGYGWYDYPLHGSKYELMQDSIRGADRVSTGVHISRVGWRNTVDSVILAPSYELMPALLVAPLAAQEDIPIFITKANENIDKRVLDRIIELSATTVYVVGNIKADELKEYNVIKLGNNDNFSIAQAVTNKLGVINGTFIVGENALPDALSIASYAGAHKYQILLQKDGKLSGEIKGDAYIIGGESVVKNIEGIKRIAGKDRWETNRAVYNAFEFSNNEIFAVDGVSLADAVTLSPFAARTNSFVCLVGTYNYPPESDWMTEMFPSSYQPPAGSLELSDFESQSKFLLDFFLSDIEIKKTIEEYEYFDKSIVRVGNLNSYFTTADFKVVAEMRDDLDAKNLALYDSKRDEKYIASHFMTEEEQREWCYKFIEATNKMKVEKAGTLPSYSFSEEAFQYAVLRSTELRDLFEHERPNGASPDSRFGELLCLQWEGGEFSLNFPLGSWYGSLKGHREVLFDSNYTGLAIVPQYCGWAWTGAVFYVAMVEW
ncbi:MAG: cell wall-binding repeat-containing protein [Endomicrobium sp.]|nr:cell wall-binding repeat-containing protein [Endomicrobium sp.]